MKTIINKLPTPAAVRRAQPFTTHSAIAVGARLLLFMGLAGLSPSNALGQDEPITPFKLEAAGWYVQVGMMVNPTPGTHVFTDPPAGPGLWCTPAELILNGFDTVTARDYPLCPAPGGLLQRTRHDSAPHAGDVVPSTPWQFDITCAVPNPGPGARETRVAGVRTHPGQGHQDLYGAVVGAMVGTVPGPSLAPRSVIIHGSIGRHTTSPPPPGPGSPMIGGCTLQPPSGQPSLGDQDYPAGELLTIVDPASGELLLLLVVEGVTEANLGGVNVRNGPGGAILMNLRPLMQTQVLDANCLALAIPNVLIPLNVAQALASGNAYIEAITTAHPDGKIVGALTAVGTTCSYQVQLQPGWNVVANQLSRGGNTLAEVLPSVPDFSTFYHWSSNGYSTSTFEADLGGWDMPTLPLAPGEGGFVRSVSGSPFTVTFVGETITPRLPLSLPYDQPVLVARQIPAPATYEEITGLSPSEGTKLYRYDTARQGDPTILSNWNAYAFSLGQWTPATPSVGIGEPVFIRVPTPTPSHVSIQTSGTNVVVSWTGSGILQMADSLRSSQAATRWTRFSNMNPYVEPANAGARFFSVTTKPGFDFDGDGQDDLVWTAHGVGYDVGGGQFVEIPADHYAVIGVANGYDVVIFDGAGNRVKTYHLRDNNGDGDFSESGEVTTTVP